MKSVMYHYIRNFDKEFSNLDVLKKKDFDKQLKYFGENNIIKNENEIYLNNNNKYILTFDDGFKDHLYIAEKLKKLG